MTDRHGDREPEEDLDVRRRLGSLRVEPADDGFRAALHRRLVAVGPPLAPGLRERVRTLLRRPGLAWPVVGLCTGAAVFAVLVAVRGGAVGPAPPGPRALAAAFSPGAATGQDGRGVVAATYQVPSSKVAVIRLNFTAEVTVEDVAFRVTLPEGLSFWGDGEKLADRSFQWKQPLQAGENAIPIAVRGERPGRYRLSATADAGGQRIEHELWLDVTEG